VTAMHARLNLSAYLQEKGVSTGCAPATPQRRLAHQPNLTPGKATIQDSKERNERMLNGK
jgi:hypothetical protein